MRCVPRGGHRSPPFVSPDPVPHLTNGSDPAPADAPVRDGPPHSSGDEAHAGEGGVHGDMLRAVMRRVVSPVTVVTAAAGGEPWGATIGSFTSASLVPPLVSFNVLKDSSLHAALLAADAFAVHLLGEGQADLAEQFALPELTSEAQFRGVAHSYAGGDVPPLLHDVFGALHCRRWAVYDAGDHSLFLGEVLRVSEGEAAGPLLYYNRSYRAVGDEV